MNTTIKFLKSNGHPMLSFALDAKVSEVLRKFAQEREISLGETITEAMREVMVERSGPRRRRSLYRE